MELEQIERIVEIRNENISNVFGEFDKNIKKLEKDGVITEIDMNERIITNALSK